MAAPSPPPNQPKSSPRRPDRELPAHHRAGRLRRPRDRHVLECQKARGQGRRRDGVLPYVPVGSRFAIKRDIIPLFPLRWLCFPRRSLRSLLTPLWRGVPPIPELRR
jgi:hypothetical protein